MTSTTKNTTTTTTTSAGTAVRPVQRGHQVAVQFSVHGVQRVDVHAHAGGGRGDQPYIAVTVGDCLTYLYDRDALAAHVRAWREAAAHNQSLRLPTAPAAQVAGPDGRQDVTVVCTVFGGQQHAVTVEAGQRTRVLSVVVGALTVRVHSSAALRCYLLAWSRPCLRPYAPLPRWKIYSPGTPEPLAPLAASDEPADHRVELANNVREQAALSHPVGALP